MRTDAIVIGGGLYGCKIALALRAVGVKKVVLIERNSRILRGASGVNQSRIHRGYHYPRSLETSRAMNEVYTRFLIDHFYAVQPSKQVYAIAAQGSKTSPEQFEKFCEKAGLPLTTTHTGLFAPGKVATEYLVEEATLNSDLLAEALFDQLKIAGVELMLGVEASLGPGVSVKTSRGDHITASYIFDVTYSNLVNISHPTTPITLGHCEIILIPEPKMLKGQAVLVLDGPFWSCAPYPTAECWQITHVTKMLHQAQYAGDGSHAKEILAGVDAYIPGLGRPGWRLSIYTTRALLDDPATDSRPALWEYSQETPRIISVLGGKLSGIYDIEDMVRKGEWAI